MTVEHYSCLRQFTGIQSHCVRWLPFPSSDGEEEHQIMIMGCLQNQVVPSADEAPGMRDIQECMLLADLTTSGGTQSPLAASVSPLATFEHAGGRMTALVAAQPSSLKATGTVVLFSGSAAGLLSCVPIDLPRHTGAQIEDIHVRGGVVETEEGAHATDGVPLHTGQISAIDVCHESDQVATGGADGQLLVFDASALADDAAGAPRTVLAGADPCHAFVDVKWTMPNSLVSAGTCGGLQLWDARSPGRSVGQSPCDWGFLGHGRGPGGSSITCLAAHPSRPHVAAVGTSDATIALWDLRFLKRPSHCALAPQGCDGAVTAVCFDRFRSRAADLPLLACTESGQLLELSVTAGGGPASARVVAEEYGAIVAMDVDSADGSRVVACTDLESLLLVDRRG